MAVDTSIYNNVRPFTMADPYESAAKVMALRDAQRKFTLEGDLAQAGAASGGDPEKMAQALMSKGHYAPAIQLRSQAATLEKERRLSRNAEVDHKLKITEAAGSDAMMLDSVYRTALQRAGGNPQAALAAVQPIYQQAREKWKGMGVELPEAFDPDQNFAFIGQAKEAIQYLKTTQPEVRMTDTGGAITPMNVNPNAGPVGPLQGASPIQKTPAPATPTELSRLQGERNAIAAQNPNDPRLKDYDRVIAGYKAGKGTEVTVNTGNMEPGKSAATKVDEAILDTGNRLMRLNQIEVLYKPEFQELGTKISNKYTSLKAMAGVKITNKERKDLEQFSAYRRNALENLNEYIRSVTGAVVNANEVPRLMGAMPNPGQGLFDGDDPVTFEAKKNDIIRMLRMGEARLAYIKRNGMSLEDGQGNPVVPLDKMPEIINQRGQAIEAELKAKQPNADSKVIQKAVRRQLGAEFGLTAD